MRILFVSALALVLTACDSSDPAVVEGTWTLTRLGDLDGETFPFRPSSVTFTAQGEYRSESCNVCQGTYRARAGTVEIDPASCTEAACAYQDQPGFLNDLFLKGTFGAAATDDSLRLTMEGTEEALIYSFVRSQGE